MASRGMSPGYQARRDALRSQPARLSESARSNWRMGTYDGYLAGVIKLPPYNPDELIQQKQYEIFDKMLQDAAVRGPVQTKKTAVLYKGVQIVPYVTDQADPRYAQCKEYADFIKYTMEHIRTDWGAEQSFEDAIFEMLDGTFTGFKVGELIYRTFEDGPYAGKWGLQRIAVKPNKQVSFELDPHTFIPLNLSEYTPLGGYQFDIPLEGAIVYTHMPHDGQPWGNPDGRGCYKHWWSRELIHKIWAIALEVFGSPFITATAPPGAMMALVASIIAKIRQGAPAVLPPGVDANLTEMTGAGVQAFYQAAEYHKMMIAENILGQTLTTSEGNRVGSMALGGVHQDTQDYWFGYTRTQTSCCWRSQCFQRLIEYNFGPENRDLAPNLFLGVWDQTDRLKYAQAVSLLLDRNVAHRTEPWVREQFGAPPIDEETAAMLDEQAERQQQAEEQPSDGFPAQDGEGGPANGG